MMPQDNSTGFRERQIPDPKKRNAARNSETNLAAIRQALFFQQSQALNFLEDLSQVPADDAFVLFHQVKPLAVGLPDHGRG